MTEMEQKIYYTIGEVSKIIDVPDYVIRYWEREFEHISPDKRRGGKRLYKLKDIENLERVKYYLYNEKYTIEGAKKFFDSRNGLKNTSSPGQLNDIFEKVSSKTTDSLAYQKGDISQVIEDIRNDLMQILKKLH